jgi:PAS domain S-box-containing protein
MKVFMLAYKRKVVIGSLLISIVLIGVCGVTADRWTSWTLILVLALQSVFFLCLIWYLSNPMQKIIEAAIKYQAGEKIVRIFIDPSQTNDEVSNLASTFNTLSDEAQLAANQAIIQKKEIESILESLSEGVFACDARAKITFASTMGCSMLGMKREEIMGKSFEELSLNSHLNEICHDLLIQTLQTFEAVHENWIASEGKSLCFYLSAIPRAQQAGAILVIQDKTSDYKMLQMGKDFIGNASHELKTPITIIRGFAEMLQDHPNLPKETIAEIMEKIIRTCGRLDTLVRSLLTLSNLENNQADSDQIIPIVDFVSQVIAHVLEVHPEAHIAMEAPNPKIMASMDPSLFEVAIRNLLENGIRYSPSPAELKITIDESDEAVLIRVADRGIGIPQTDLPYIFNRFYTVDKARSRKSGGSGLGLSIAKAIIERHQGQIKVTSELGKGSEFVVELPTKIGSSLPRMH